MTEDEQLDLFERKVRRYLAEVGKLSLEEDAPEFGIAANEYFDAAANLGASLLLRMVEALRERDVLRAEVLRIGEQIEAAITSDGPRLRARSLPQLDFDAAELPMLWRRYAKVDPETLTPAAQMLGERLRAVFEEVPQN